VSDYIAFLEREFTKDDVTPASQYKAHRAASHAPVGSAAQHPERGQNSREEWKIAAGLVAPSSRFGSLFGVTEKDIVRASRLLAGFSELPISVRFLKRLLDIVLSASLLLALAPVFLIISVKIRLDSPGPALYRQSRVGRGGKVFEMLQFRTMHLDSEGILNRALATIADGERSDGVLFKLVNDPRVTRVGRVLRKYSLDELPQLFNVLRGEMSVVGPRPHLISENDAYDSYAGKRSLIRPGITGLWQTMGRSNLSWEDSLRLDLYYAENWSLAGDLVILWRTVRLIASARSTY
jgi:lipopolysaccharide/colanic/teichoic acid biosynthesis glycosyltransferase